MNNNYLKEEYFINSIDIKNLTLHIEKNIKDFLNKIPSSDQERKIIELLNEFKDKSTSGDPEARSIVKNRIKNILLNSFNIYKIIDDKLEDIIIYESIKIDDNSELIDYMLPFDNPSKLTTEEKFIIILFKNFNLGKNNKDESFKSIIEKYDIFKKCRKTDFYESINYEISKEDIDLIYNKENIKLNFSDKVEIITQILYQNIFGLKEIDILAYSDVNEVGFSKDGEYVYCWCDDKYWLSFIKFDAETARIIQEHAISFDKNAPQLDESNPEVLCRRADNARITVTQKPYFSARNLCIRIFNKDNDSFSDLITFDKLRTMLTTLVKVGEGVCLQGNLGVGKTTTMKLLFEILDDNLHIGTVEDYFEQHNMDKYPYKRIVEGQSLDNKSLLDVVKTLLRMSVDVADLGEVRDGEALFAFIQLVLSVSVGAWFTTHVVNPDKTVPRLKNMLISTGKYFSEQSAVMDIIHSINIILQHEIINGNRLITQAVEIIPLVDTSSKVDYHLNTDKDTLEKMFYLQQIQSNPSNMYMLNPIMEYANGEYKFLNYPSKRMINKAKLNKESWSYMLSLLNLIEKDTGKPFEGGDR